jgi:LysR family transcriptional regulator, glycine cleavage system transcriptional activator
LVINFAARSTAFVFDDEHFDAAIHFGQPDWPNACHDFLFSEELVPMLAPHWLQTQPLQSPQELLSLPLLHLSSRPDAWSNWARSIACPIDGEVNRSATFEQFLMLTQAAVAGAGAALIPTFLVQPELEAGTLIIPFDLKAATDAAYFLVYPEERLSNPSFAAFRTWLLQEARRDSASGSQ